MTAEFPKLIFLSGPMKDQSFDVDEKGVRVSEDCIVRLCDGRAVAYSLRKGQERPWQLLDHATRLESGSIEFRLDHPELEADAVLAMFSEVENEEIESFFLGLLMGRIERPIAAAVLLDNWKPGETAFATFVPGFFNPRYHIVNETRRQSAPGVYDEAEHVYCARIAFDSRYIGAVYVKSLTPVPFRPEERAEITRIAAYVAIYTSIRDLSPLEPKRKEEESPRRISCPADLEVVFEETPPAYRFGHYQEQPAIEQVPSTMEVLLEKVLFGIFYNINTALEGAVCLEIADRPLHFIRRQRPEDFEIDKDVVYRAFVLDVEAARNADGTVWAVPILGRERRLGVVYVKVEKNRSIKGDLIEHLETIATMAAAQDYPENPDPLF